tara:strand:- start:631 stop:1143 length:513 start_codon:yes stop_codon:yes gene_type:complete
MYDQIDAVKNINQIYNSNTQFSVLKDFERVLDELDIYVYDNWEDGELVAGPEIERHWVTCSFMWDYKSMPDPEGGKRLTDYDCKVSFEKTHFISPRKIKTPDDLRPMSKKGKLDRHPVWVVTIKMPKTLIADIYTGYNDAIESMKEPTTQVQQPVDVNQEQELDTDLDTI